MIISYLGIKPEIHHSSKIFAGSIIIGDVKIGEKVGVWYHCVIRGDMSFVKIGNHTNIQEGSIIHTNKNLPTKIGNHVTIGHQSIIHAATIEDGVLIGMGSIILDGAIIKSESIVAAGTLVPPGKIVESRTLVMGNPIKVVRKLTDEDVLKIYKNANDYVSLLNDYKDS